MDTSFGGLVSQGFSYLAYFLGGAALLWVVFAVLEAIPGALMDMLESPGPSDHDGSSSGSSCSHPHSYTHDANCDHHSHHSD